MEEEIDFSKFGNRFFIEIDDYFNEIMLYSAIWNDKNKLLQLTCYEVRPDKTLQYIESIDLNRDSYTNDFDYEDEIRLAKTYFPEFTECYHDVIEVSAREYLELGAKIAELYNKQVELASQRLDLIKQYKEDDRLRKEV